MGFFSSTASLEFYIQWSLRITDMFGTWLLSVVENCPFLGDCLISNFMLGKFNPCHEVCLAMPLSPRLVIARGDELKCDRPPFEEIRYAIKF